MAKASDFVLAGTDFIRGINRDGRFFGGGVGREAFGTDVLKPGTPPAGFPVSRDGQTFTNEAPAGRVRRERDGIRATAL